MPWFMIVQPRSERLETKSERYRRENPWATISVFILSINRMKIWFYGLKSGYVWRY